MITDIDRLNATIRRLEYRDGWHHRDSPAEGLTILISVRALPDDVVDIVTWFIDGQAEAERTKAGARLRHTSGPADEVIDAVLGWSS